MVEHSAANPVRCEREIKALAERLMRLIRAELARDPPPADEAAYEAMLRHVKGIIKAESAIN